MRRKRDAGRHRGELNRTSPAKHKRRRGEREQAEEDKRARASEARACSLVAYRAARLRLKVRLQVQGRVEIAAGVADAAALDGVHAHRDTAVVVRDHGRRRVCEATLGLGALARAALELPAHLHHHTPAMSPLAPSLPSLRAPLYPLFSSTSHRCLAFYIFVSNLFVRDITYIFLLNILTATTMINDMKKLTTRQRPFAFLLTNVSESN